VNIKIAGKWMFIPLKLVFIGIDPSPYIFHMVPMLWKIPNSENGNGLRLPADPGDLQMCVSMASPMVSNGHNNGSINAFICGYFHG